MRIALAILTTGDARLLENRIGPAVDDARDLEAHVLRTAIRLDTARIRDDEDDEEQPAGDDDDVVSEADDDVPTLDTGARWAETHEESVDDDGRYVAWRRAVQAGLRACASHILIVNDDVQPCDGFRRAITKACRAFDACDAFPIVNLLASHEGASRVRDESDQRWYTTARTAGSEAMLMTAVTATKLLRFIDGEIAPGTLKDEVDAINRFTAAEHCRIWHPCPSFVDAPSRFASVPSEPSMSEYGWGVFDADMVMHLE